MTTTTGRSALVTGASTGIGRATTLRLAASGWRVFAGVRQRCDGDSVATAAGENRALITPVLLDVTNESQIAAAVEMLQRALGPAGLSALINNAGIVIAGPVEGIPLEEWRTQFDVNVFGQIAVTQAFLPLVRRARGRVVLVSSIAGRLGQPFVGPYCASKHALEAIGDALRIELANQGVGVVLIEPGAVKTPIWNKSRDTAEHIQGKYSNAIRSQYGEAMERVRQTIGAVEAGGLPPAAVAAAIERALNAKKAPSRVLIGADAKVGAFIKRFLPTTLIDRLLIKGFGLK